MICSLVDNSSASGSDDLFLDLVFEFIEEFIDHGSGFASTTHFLVWKSLVDHGEGVAGIVTWEKSGEPGEALFFGLWTPLGGACFATHDSEAEGGVATGSVGRVNDVFHSLMHDFDGFRVEIEVEAFFGKRRFENASVEVLDLLREPEPSLRAELRKFCGPVIIPTW